MFKLGPYHSRDGLGVLQWRFPTGREGRDVMVYDRGEDCEQYGIEAHERFLIGYTVPGRFPIEYAFASTRKEAEQALNELMS